MDLRSLLEAEQGTWSQGAAVLHNLRTLRGMLGAAEMPEIGQVDPQVPEEHQKIMSEILGCADIGKLEGILSKLKVLPEHKTNLSHWGPSIQRLKDFIKNYIRETGIMARFAPAKILEQPANQKPIQKQCPDKATLLVILKFLQTLLKDGRRKMAFSATTEVSLLIAASDNEIVEAALDLVNELVCVTDRPGSINSVLSRIPNFTKKLLTLSYGYGPGTLEMLAETNPQLSDEIKKRGGNVHINLYQNSYDNDKAWSKESNDEPKHTSETLFQFRLENAAQDTMPLEDRFKEMTKGKPMPQIQAFVLWMRLRMAQGFGKGLHSEWLRIRLKALTVLAFGTVNSSEIPIFFHHQSGFLLELKRCLKNDKIDDKLKALIFHTLSALIRGRMRGSTVVEALLPSGQARLYHGIISNCLRTIETNMSEAHQSEYLDGFFTLMISLSNCGQKKVQESGLVSQIVQLLDLSHKSNNTYIIEQSAKVLRVLLHPSRHHRGMTQSTAHTQIVQAGALGHVVNIIIDQVDKKINKKDKMEDEKEENLVDKSQQGFNLKLLFNVLMQMLQVRSREIQIRQVIEGPLLKTLNSVMENHESFSAPTIMLTLKIISSMLNSEPTAISLIMTSGSLQHSLKILSSQSLDGRILACFPEFFRSFSLNTTCFKEISNLKGMQKLIRLIIVPHQQYLTMDQVYDIGQSVNSFMRNHVSIRNDLIAEVLEMGKSLTERIESVTKKEPLNVKEVKDCSVSVSRLMDFLSCILSHSEHQKLFVSKGGVQAFIKLVLVQSEGASTSVYFLRTISQSVDIFAMCSDYGSAIINNVGQKIAKEYANFVLNDQAGSQLCRVTSLVKILNATLVHRTRNRNLMKDTLNTFKEFLPVLSNALIQIQQSVIREKKKKKERKEAKAKEQSSKDESDNKDKSDSKDQPESMESEPKSPTAQKPSDRIHIYSITFLLSHERLYSHLCRWISQIVSNSQQGGDGNDSLSASLKLAEIIGRILTKFLLSYNKGDEPESFDEECTRVSSILQLIYLVIYSDSHPNAAILSAFHTAGGVKALTQIYEKFVLKILDNPPKDPEPTKNDKNDKKELKKKTGPQIALLHNLGRFFTSIVNVSKLSRSPVSVGLSEATKKSYDPIKLSDKIKEQIAGTLMKCWEHPNLVKVSPAFGNSVINAVAFIVKKNEPQESPDVLRDFRRFDFGGNRGIRLGRAPPPRREVNQAGLDQLMAMGFPEARSRRAMIQANNNWQLAMEILLEGVDDDEEEEEEQPSEPKEEEKSKEEDGKPKEEESVQMKLLQEKALDWTVGVLKNNEHVSFACSDLLSLISTGDDKTVQDVTSPVIDSFKKGSPDVDSKAQVKTAVKLLIDMHQTNPLKRSYFLKDGNMIQVLLDELKETFETGNKELRLDLLRFFNSLVLKKMDDTKKLTIDTLQDGFIEILNDEEREQLLTIVMASFDDWSQIDSDTLNLVLEVITELTASFSIAQQAKQAGIAEKLLAIPGKLQGRNFVRQVELIFRNMIEDEETLEWYLETKLTTFLNEFRRMKIQEVFDHFSSFLNRCPKQLFKILKKNCVLRNRAVCLKPGIKLPTYPKEVYTNSKEVVMECLLKSLLRFGRKSDTEGMLTKAEFLKLIATFARNYNCAGLLLKFNDDSLKKYSGENKVIRFVIEETLAFPFNPMHWEIFRGKTQKVTLFHSSRMGAFLLASLMAKYPHEVLKEISMWLEDFQKSETSSAQLRTFHAVADFLAFLLISSHGSREELRVLVLYHSLLQKMTNAIGHLDLNHPDTPEITYKVLEFIHSAMKHTHGTLPDNLEEKAKIITQVKLSFSPFAVDLKRMKNLSLPNRRSNSQEEEEEEHGEDVEEDEEEEEEDVEGEQEDEDVEEEGEQEEEEGVEQARIIQELLLRGDDSGYDDRSAGNVLTRFQGNIDEILGSNMMSDMGPEPQYEPVNPSNAAAFPFSGSIFTGSGFVHLNPMTNATGIGRHRDPGSSSAFEQVLSGYLNSDQSSGGGEEDTTFRNHNHMARILGNLLENGLDDINGLREAIEEDNARPHSSDDEEEEELGEDMQDEDISEQEDEIEDDDEEGDSASYSDEDGNDDELDPVTNEQQQNAQVSNQEQSEPNQEGDQPQQPEQSPEQPVDTSESNQEQSAQEDQPPQQPSSEQPSSEQPAENSESNQEQPPVDQQESKESTEEAEPSTETTDAFSIIDPTFLAALPEDLRREVLTQHIASLCNTQANPTQNQSTISQTFLNALPDDVRAEVLERERQHLDAERRRNSPPQNPSGDNSNADNNEEDGNEEAPSNSPADSEANQANETAMFIASLPPDLRQEVLLDSDDQLIAQLPPDIAAEAYALRNSFVERQMRAQRRPRLTERAQLRQQQQKSLVRNYSKKDTTSKPIFSQKDMISLFRLLYLSKCICRNQLQHIFSIMCKNKTNRHEMLELLLAVLKGDSQKGKFEECLMDNILSLDPTASLELLPPSNRIPLTTTERLLDVLQYICRHNDKVLLHLTTKQGEQLPLTQLFELMKGKTFKAHPILTESILSILLLVFEYLTKLTKALQQVREKMEEANKKKSSKRNEEKLKRMDGWIKDVAGVCNEAINEKIIGYVVEILMEPSCRESAAKSAVQLLTTLCQIKPDSRTNVLKELAKIARKEAHLVVPALRKSAQKLAQKEELSSQEEKDSMEIESRFSRIIKTYASILSDSLAELEGALKEFKEMGEDVSDLQSEMDAVHELKEYQLDFVWESLQVYMGKNMTPSSYARLLPLVEAFFCFQSCFIRDDDGEEEELVKNMKLETPTSATPVGRLETFLEKNREALNELVRCNTQLLDNSLSLFIKKYFKYVDFDIKRVWFRKQLDKDRENLNSLPRFRITVRRKFAFVDAYFSIRQAHPEELKQRLNVHFQGEEGEDAGGLTREFFTVLSREMFNPDYAFFTMSADRLYQPNPNSHFIEDHLEYFKVIARVIAMGIYSDHLLDCYFTRSFYKHILGRAITYHDVESVDPDLYKNFKWMLENSIEGVIDDTFTYTLGQLHNHKLIPLKEGGEKIPVTDENKHEYVKLRTERIMTTQIKDQLHAFLKAFYEIIPKKLISIFNAEELELLISGLPEFDVDNLKANTVYVGYSEQDPVIQWFWRWVSQLNQNDKAIFLQFVTGTSKIPLDGFGTLMGMNGITKFNIHKVHDDKKLPSAHSCFNQLDLPQYSSYDILKQKMYFAIRETDGFGLV